MKPNPHWPVLTTYDSRHLRRIAMPTGGIGTGTVSLGGAGDLRDWEIVNKPAKGFNPAFTFFALRARHAGGQPIARALMGPLDPADYEASHGATVPNHGLPRFTDASFAAAYPFGQVLLADKEFPLEARVEVFNPLVPGDLEASSLPVLVYRVVLANRTTKRVDATVCGNLQNFLGADGNNHNPAWAGGRSFDKVMLGNTTQLRREGSLTGLSMTTTGTKPDAPAFGTLALITTAKTGISHRTSWAKRGWGDSLLDYWDDLLDDGKLDDRPQEEQRGPIGSLAVSLRIPPRATREVTFLITWHFPNRVTWTPAKKEEKSVPLTVANDTPPGASACCAPGEVCDPAEMDPNWIGNHYTTLYKDAWDAAARITPRLRSLEEKTLAFVGAFCESDLPPAVKEAALYNVSTLRTQTTFRIADGHVFGWEGCFDFAGCCHGSCTHVWNYENAVGFLFGEAARSQREVEFLHATHDNGLMSFRVNLPLARAKEFAHGAADGQMGSLVRLYRDWRLCGDDAWLRRLWPHARKAMEYCWIEGGWDADHDGVMEGCQHNTMDVEYFGPNPQMQVWYLAALRACEEMARAVCEGDFADRCRLLFETGRAWTDANLFNGEYYEHLIRPIPDASRIAPGLRIGMGTSDLSDPILQLGAGCLVDQLVGQYMAHAVGLGYVVDPDHSRATHAAIMRHNFKQGFHDHFNHMRSFVLGDESALLMATYPRGRRPKQPFPYYNEVMTGFEYTAAAGMIYEGLEQEGLRCIRAIRERYDGWKRSPFNEAECGHHYARAMASWTALLALTGFGWSALEGAIRFRAPRAGKKPTRWFWSNGSAWGSVRLTANAKAVTVELTVTHGELILRRVEIAGVGELLLPTARTLRAGGAAKFTVKKG